MAKLESIAMLAELDGAVLVDKPANMASHDVVKVVKQHFNLVKAGHGGTLEPNATGLFILLVGDGTRLAADLMGRDRAFTATIRLGRVTDTQDREGRTISEAPVAVTREALDAALPEFCGDIFQTPPAFSTIKMTGHPGYDIVETPADERAARLVHVYRLVVTDFAPPLVTFDLLCTKGVCVRALTHDIGAVLGCGACLESLRRVKCGPLDVADAISFMDLLKLDAVGFRARVVRPGGVYAQ